MNSSAKITITFLAAAALGAAVCFTGCTVTSGTVSDTDGGTSTSSGGSSGTTSSGGSSGTTSSGGTDSGSGGTCQTAGNVKFSDVAACEACLDNKCCDKLKTCFAIPEDKLEDGGAAGKLNCDGYADCIDNCTTTKTGSELETCYNDCDALGGTGVQTAYEAIVDCSSTNCATECSGEVPDGG